LTQFIVYSNDCGQPAGKFFTVKPVYLAVFDTPDQDSILFW